jgi:general secretion pathway protein L
MVAESVISVHLAPELAFITTLELPTAAEINLKKVLQHHIGLCVPLEPDDVVFDFAITARDTFRQTVFVDVAIVRRATIASALAATRELNCKASSVKVQSETHEWLNFEFHVGDTPNIVTERSKKTSLTACALLLAGCCVTSWLWQSHIYLGTLDDSLASLHKQAAPAFELRARLSSLRDQVDYINRSVRGPGRLVVLNELTRCMPDSVWVSDLQITGTHVTMSGNGLAVAGIIRLLGLSEILASPRFTAPIYSWQDGTERFEIAADIKALP